MSGAIPNISVIPLQDINRETMEKGIVNHRIYNSCLFLIIDQDIANSTNVMNNPPRKYTAPSDLVGFFLFLNARIVNLENFPSLKYGLSIRLSHSLYSAKKSSGAFLLLISCT